VEGEAELFCKESLSTTVLTALFEPDAQAAAVPRTRVAASKDKILVSFIPVYVYALTKLIVSREKLFRGCLV
jgi:hypothetical protein